MAMVITGANMAGIYGAQLFRADDSPRYRRAFAVNCAIIAFGVLLAIGRYYDDVRRGIRHLTNQRAASISSGSEIDEKGTVVPPSEDLPAPLVATDGKKLSVSNGIRV